LIGVAWGDVGATVGASVDASTDITEGTGGGGVLVSTTSTLSTPPQPVSSNGNMSPINAACFIVLIW